MKTRRFIVVALALATALVVACSKKADQAATGKHEHHAPHKGALEELGDEFAHVELVLDEKTGKLTAFILDGEAENPVRIAQDVLRLKITGIANGDATVELKAVPNALSGEKVGDTSQFEGASDRLKGVSKFGGSLDAITVKGKSFAAVEIGYPDGNEHEEKNDAAK